MSELNTPYSARTREPPHDVMAAWARYERENRAAAAMYAWMPNTFGRPGRARPCIGCTTPTDGERAVCPTCRKKGLR